MWIIYALLVHILLLGSIFVIYFRSPVIKGLEPQQPLSSFGLEPPADRLVLIVTDGLRADSFFDGNCRHVPHLREIFLHEGLVGISRTRVPTESRPGHIALIAGLYEDPSAVTRGWKENPIEFDTVFNRSGHTYAWGAHDVLHIFEKLSSGGRPMHFDSYNHDLDFSGQHKTYKLDEWVFDKVRFLLNRKREELQKAKPVVFFLHLLGMDTAGHVHKPGTPLFLENLNYSEHGIWQIYQKFEEIFPDKRTVYLMTSDHGMTDSGSHGAGAPHETDTPFILWGSGVVQTANTPSKQTFVANDEGKRLPLHELEQAQLTPLMSALIGLPPPMNNFGMLPMGYINASAEYEAMAAYSNAQQLLGQYQMLFEEHKRGVLSNYLNSFGKLTTKKIQDYKLLTANLRANKSYAESIVRSRLIMEQTLEGIDYYHGYYGNVLLLSTTATFLGWIYYLYQLLTAHRTKAKRTGHNIWLEAAVIIGLIIFLVAQRVPLVITFYLLLPLFIWRLALKPNLGYSAAFAYSQPSTHLASKKQLLLLIGCAELLVFTFFERRLISLCFLVISGYSWLENFKSDSRLVYGRLILIAVLTLFPLLPPSVGYQNSHLVFIGILVIFLNALWSKKQRLGLSLHTKICNAFILLNAAVCVHLNSNHQGIPLPLYIASWLFLIYAFGSILINKETDLELRLAQICYNLNALYAMLCTSYEALFIQLLIMELSMSLDTSNRNSTMAMQQSPLRLAFTIVLYTFFSMFGSGNIASISSFDPNITRCFIGHFAPFIMMALVLLKLLVPLILNMSVVYTHCGYARQQETRIFICLLLICDIMGLNFLYLVRNQGSWLEIGSSISHFVIMEMTTLILLLVAYGAKLLLGLTAFNNVTHKQH
ncbi:uncharacterized protein Dwil_GK21360 [Drosophila willistoni]|uniref:GPI ethanolamine phosphate transferase 1 n=1 Tax=Drosophila willistoni TaxID=7260 RepID=B4MQX5_DROWI|nr:GPI ethanolamine phosphate transferase 1 [Drosophila willistoni]EDW74514.1 uncharacterized protein Dwil_GK21360 [Drosophila willistoni]